MLAAARCESFSLPQAIHCRQCNYRRWDGFFGKIGKDSDADGRGVDAGVVAATSPMLMKVQRGGKDRFTLVESLRRLDKCCDAPTPRGRVSNPPLVSQLFFCAPCVLCGELILSSVRECDQSRSCLANSQPLIEFVTPLASAADRAAGRAEFLLLRRRYPGRLR